MLLVMSSPGLKVRAKAEPVAEGEEGVDLVVERVFDKLVPDRFRDGSWGAMEAAMMGLEGCDLWVALLNCGVLVKA